MTKEIRSILATDCGSTTTKAILIEKQGDAYRLVTRGEAPTTVEAPFEDVTRGVLNAVKEVEELRGRKMLDGDRIITPQNGEEGVDWLFSFISADKLRTYCLYEAPTPDAILEAARRANVPADKIVEVSRFEPAALR